MVNFMRLLAIKNGLVGGEYVEPYAGGGSVALGLLFSGLVEAVHINDADPAIFAFWKAAVHETDRFCNAIQDAVLTVDSWRGHQQVYLHSNEGFDLGFSTFFLNRTNRSGIIRGAGIIGGLDQTGKWGMDARFPRDELIRRVRRVGAYRNRIAVTGLDACELLRTVGPKLPERSLIYLDPPYYEKGQQLYANFYQPEDHAEVAEEVAKLAAAWVVSYDNVPAIRGLYEKHTAVSYGLRYTARTRYDGQEIMFFSPGLVPPDVDNPSSIHKDQYRRLVRQLESQPS